MPPPPGGDASAAPPPPDGGLVAPPTDKLFPDNGAQAAEEPAPKKHGKHHKGKGGKVNEYTVEHHDSLWTISAKNRVYGDAFQWPILFIANRDQIKDPDLIKPGWDLKVKRDLGSDEVSQAVTKAKDTPRYEPHTTVREKLPIDY